MVKASEFPWPPLRSQTGSRGPKKQKNTGKQSKIHVFCTIVIIKTNGFFTFLRFLQFRTSIFTKNATFWVKKQ